MWCSGHNHRGVVLLAFVNASLLAAIIEVCPVVLHIRGVSSVKAQVIFLILRNCEHCSPQSQRANVWGPLFIFLSRSAWGSILRTQFLSYLKANFSDSMVYLVGLLVRNALVSLETDLGPLFKVRFRLKLLPWMLCLGGFLEYFITQLLEQFRSKFGDSSSYLE